MRIDAAFGGRGQPPAAVEAAAAADGVFDEVIDAVRIEVSVSNRLGSDGTFHRGRAQRVVLRIGPCRCRRGLHDPHVVKTGRAERERLRGSHRQSDLNGAGQPGQRDGFDQRPGAAIRGSVGRDRVATADEAHPVVRRGVHRRATCVTGGRIDHRTPDHAEAVVLRRRRGEDGGMA